MKTKNLVIILFLLFVATIVTKNDGKLIDILLSLVNPIKQTYTNVTRDIEDKSQSYVYQKESIERLTKENKFLRKRLLEQKHYIQQVKDLYTRIPSLERIPRRSVEIVQTISYVKLNSFSQVILTKPDTLIDSNKTLYGLVQDDVVAGVAQIRNNNLYGSLISNDNCRFSVFVGKDRAAGIAMGINANKMYVKFIPKWSNIKVGDQVVTSGLDTIFFANIPVGVVQSIEIENSYKVAYIKGYANVLKPDYFFLIRDPSVTLASKFDGRYISNQNGKEQNASSINYQMQDPKISSIPSVLPTEPESISQTNDEEVTLEQENLPTELPEKVTKKRKKVRKIPQVNNLNLF